MKVRYYLCYKEGKIKKNKKKLWQLKEKKISLHTQ
jgi:hypothetical protein